MPGPPTCICTLTAIDGEGTPEVGVAYVAAVYRGDGTAGLGISGAPVVKTTNGSGVATFTLIRGKRYFLYRQGSPGNAVPVVVPDEATYTLPEVIGQS